MTVLEYRGVGRTYGSGDTAVDALRNVDLTLRQGELVLVMGPSGSGKSTMLLLGGALDLPSTGVVKIGDKDTTTMSPAQRAAVRRQAVGYVFQQFNLLPQLTAVENVSLPLELDGTPRRSAVAEAQARMRELNIGELGEKYPDQLSGGEQQRVAIARALVGGRRLILADEPTGALDSDSGRLVMDLIRGQVDSGAAAMVVTHNSAHAQFADRVVTIADGVIGESPLAVRNKG